ncbi:sugar MFS transporter [Streptomyces sp. TLI_171]|uniref:MFS transporter n=1 Tax=Streptomyces sp. TLI_171 TaxID=1938859 RepID=UPI000C50AD92|nr:MFS transporter [Streptomyces sp. TLI_171]RKE22083.1 fucose permease [Streptomyces sp. TLI_171]
MTTVHQLVRSDPPDPIRPESTMAMVETSGDSGAPMAAVLRLGAVFGFLSVGMGLAPALATAWSAVFALDGGSVANIHNLKDLGLIAAMVAGPVVLRRYGPERAMRGAVVTALAGCAAAFACRSYVGVLAAVFLHGAAFSLGSSAAVLALFRLPPEFRRLAALTATFGLAGILAPAAVGMLMRTPDAYSLVYAGYAVPLGALYIWLCAVRRSVGGGQSETAAGRVDHGSGGMGRVAVVRVIRIWAPELVVYALILGGETVVVSWVTAIGQWRYGYTLAHATALLSLLWAVHTAARACGDVLARSLPVPRLLVIGCVVAVLGIVGLCSGEGVLVHGGVVVFAVGIAPLNPLHQGWVLARASDDERAVLNSGLGVMAAAATTALVWLTGLAVDRDNRLPFVVAVILLAMVGSWAAVRGTGNVSPEPRRG